MTRLIVLFAIVFSLCQSSCDPGLNGDLKVLNQTDSVLNITVGTASYTVQPHTEQIILILGHIGNQKTFDCCPCELTDSVHISSSAGVIQKDPMNTENWAIPNKSKQKKFGGEDLRCEFYVTPGDL
jgi:hypothetical protein